VNTRKSAKSIFDKVKAMREEGFEVYHLSTSMCSVHRKNVINAIKKALKANRKMICVTTQLIEAGVDISFSCVVRACAGLDSVTQAAGRCNRNGESTKPREVYVVPLIDENLDKLEDIKAGKEITKRLITENPGADLLEQKIMDQFYEYYFYDRKDLMNYPTDDGESVYEMLSLNKAGRGNHKNKLGFEYPCCIANSFHTADMDYSVIGNTGEAVVVSYGESEELMAEYQKQPKNIITKTKLDIIRKLEKYSISLYKWEMEALAGGVYFLDEENGIAVLDDRHYQEDLGLVLDTDPSDYMI